MPDSIRPLRVPFVRLTALVLAAGGCTEVAASMDANETVFPTAALTTAASQDGHWQVEVRTAPTQPPPRGPAAAELRIRDPNGQLADGLQVQVVPWMPAMGHGAAGNPTVTAKGQGRYLVQPLNFSMAGEWQLRIDLHQGLVADHADASLQVP